jgi:hypothetical protein
MLTVKQAQIKLIIYQMTSQSLNVTFYGLRLRRRRGRRRAIKE